VQFEQSLCISALMFEDNSLPNTGGKPVTPILTNQKKPFSGLAHVCRQFGYGLIVFLQEYAANALL